ncbi:hypothetical protein EON64_03925 [archaeon]|nr:MAG: hypothetical protein EON64_03925 [archaeon]
MQVLLEVTPSTSLRLYLGGGDSVLRMTPLPESRQHAAAWVDALFAGMGMGRADVFEQCMSMVFI